MDVYDGCSNGRNNLEKEYSNEMDDYEGYSNLMLTNMKEAGMEWITMKDIQYCTEKTKMQDTVMTVMSSEHNYNMTPEDAGQSSVIFCYTRLLHQCGHS